MKIEIDCSTLKTELSKIKEIVVNRTTIPMLSNVLLEAKEDRLIIKATDLEVTISTSCECNVIEEGACAVHALTLLRAVSTIGDSTIGIEVETNHWAKLYTTAGKEHCRITGTHYQDFPEIADVSNIEFFKMDARLFLDMINRTSFSICTDDARPNLTGSFLRYTMQHTLLMVTTDGHRLSKYESMQEDFVPHTDVPNKLINGVIIPSRAIKQLARTIDADAYDFEFGVHNNSNSTIAFRHGPMLLTTRLLDGHYPDYKQILPRNKDNPAILSREEFLNALKFVQLFSNNKSNTIKLTLTNDKLSIYASDPETGEGTKDIEVDYDGPERVIGFNHKYISEVLHALESDDISLNLIDELSPSLIKNPNSDNILYVVMPMRF